MQDLDHIARNFARLRDDELRTLDKAALTPEARKLLNAELQQRLREAATDAIRLPLEAERLKIANMKRVDAGRYPLDAQGNEVFEPAMGVKGASRWSFIWAGCFAILGMLTVVSAFYLSLPLLLLAVGSAAIGRGLRKNYKAAAGAFVALFLVGAGGLILVIANAPEKAVNSNLKQVGGLILYVLGCAWYCLLLVISWARGTLRSMPKDGTQGGS